MQRDGEARVGAGQLERGPLPRRMQTRRPHLWLLIAVIPRLCPPTDNGKLSCFVMCVIQNRDAVQELMKEAFEILFECSFLAGDDECVAVQRWLAGRDEEERCPCVRGACCPLPGPVSDS